MNIYAIYVNSQKKDNNFVIIQQGFSFAAAIFNVVWAFYHRMWLLSIFTLIFNIIIFSFDWVSIITLLPIINLLIFGFCGDDMLEYEIKRKKYLLRDIVVARSEIEAELRFLEKNSFIMPT